MASLKDFRIPVKGLPEGFSQFDFQLDSSFFGLLPEGKDPQGEFNVDVEVFKKPSIIQMDFALRGWVERPCDTCLESIKIRCSGEYLLYGKYESQEQDEDVVTLDAEQAYLDLSHHLYEYAWLSLPITNKIDCEEMEDPPCNLEMINRLNQDDKSDQETVSPWDALKGIEIKKES